MKYIIPAVIILAVLVAWFSFYGDTTPYNFPPIQGWAFFSGKTGNAIPGKGEAGEAETFTLEQSETKAAPPLETEKTEPDSIFTVSVKQTPVYEYVLIGVAITLSIEVIVLGIVAIILWIKTK